MAGLFDPMWELNWEPEMLLRWKTARFLVGIPCNSGQVPAEFVSSAWQMDMPPNCAVHFSSGLDVAEMRNQLGHLAMQMGADYLLMLDSDMVYPRETIRKLFEADAEVIVGFSVTRRPPHWPLFLRKDCPEGLVPQELPRYRNYFWWPTQTGAGEGHYIPGAQPVSAVGGAALLIKTPVFGKLPEPWFNSPYVMHEGKLAKVGEDVFFSEACAEAGIHLQCRTDLWIGHLTKAELTPQYDALNGRWKINIKGIGANAEGKSSVLGDPTEPDESALEPPPETLDCPLTPSAAYGVENAPIREAAG